MTLIACYWNGGQCLHSADRGSIQKILSGNSQLCVSVCVGMICLYALLLLLLPLLSLFFSLSLVCFNRTVAVENINRCERVGERTKRREISEQQKMLKERGNRCWPGKGKRQCHWQRDWQWQGPIEKQLISKWNPSSRGRRGRKEERTQDIMDKHTFTVKDWTELN